jgi:hypothetical protein
MGVDFYNTILLPAPAGRPSGCRKEKKTQRSKSFLACCALTLQERQKEQPSRVCGLLTGGVHA